MRTHVALAIRRKRTSPLPHSRNGYVPAVNAALHSPSCCDDKCSRDTFQNPQSMRTEQRDIREQEKEAEKYQQLKASLQQEKNTFTLWKLFCIETGTLERGAC